MSDQPMDSRPKAVESAEVLVVENIWGAAFDELAEHYSVSFDPELYKDPEALKKSLTGVRALVVRNKTEVDSEILRAATSLEIVARAGVGLDNIDLKAADQEGVVVVAAIGANARSVAEHALALAFALAREVPLLDASVRQGEWDRRLGIELANRTWGVVGLGATGRETSRLAKAIGMDVIGYDPFVSGDSKIIGIDEVVVDLKDLLARSDVVSLHIPLTEDTSKLVDGKFLASMRKDAFLINSSRGGLVDEDALFASLEDGTIRGAGLDVRAEEPPGPHPLNAHPKVVHSPHVAGLTEESQVRVTEMLADEIKLVLAGNPATKSVSAHKLPAK